MLTASGDSTCIFWDIERSEPLWRFTDHTSDVMSVSSCPAHPALFVSGSTDSTAKTWDLRSGKCTQTFVGHESDINAVAYMRHGQVSTRCPGDYDSRSAPTLLLERRQVFGTASDDCTVKLFEQRSYSRINEMANDTVSAMGKQSDKRCVSMVSERFWLTQVMFASTSLDFSLSGRLLFAGYDDCNAYGWDSLADSAPSPVQVCGCGGEWVATNCALPTLAFVNFRRCLDIQIVCLALESVPLARRSARAAGITILQFGPRPFVVVSPT